MRKVGAGGGIASLLLLMNRGAVIFAGAGSDRGTHAPPVATPPPVAAGAGWLVQPMDRPALGAAGEGATTGAGASTFPSHIHEHVYRHLLDSGDPVGLDSDALP